MSPLHTRIKELRNSNGWTQAELAEKLDIETRMVSQYENKKAVPSAETLLKLSAVFKVSVDYLLIENAIKTPLENNPQNEFLEKINEIEALPDDDKKMILRLIDSLITNNKIKELTHKSA